MAKTGAYATLIAKTMDFQETSTVIYTYTYFSKDAKIKMIN